MISMNKPILIKGGRIVDPAQTIDAVGNILLMEGEVAWLSSLGGDMPVDESACEVVSAKGRIVAPGFVDLHCHLREPGFEGKETIATGARAAAAGGFTTVCCMPNTNPAMDDKSVAELVLRIAREQGVVRVLPIGAISRGLEGKSLAEMGELARAGAVGFSDDGHPAWDAALMRHAMEYSLSLGLPVIDHCQEPGLTSGSSMHEGEVAARLGLKGWPAAAEEIMVARDIELCRLTGARLHIAHVSTAGAAELLRRAKAEGLPVTAEVTPHHLTLTHHRVMGAGKGLAGLEMAKDWDSASMPYDTSAKVNPPLRTEADIKALIQGLKDGTIDCIATDHAPHALEDKLCEFDQAAVGISGFETALGALMSLVHGGQIDITALISKLTWGPAQILGANREAAHPEGLVEGRAGRHVPRSPLVPEGLGTLRLGAPADVAVIDPDAEWTVDPSQFLSKGKNTPLAGVCLKGRVVGTYVGGVRVHEVEG